MYKHVRVFIYQKIILIKPTPNDFIIINNIDSFDFIILIPIFYDSRLVLCIRAQCG